MIIRLNTKVKQAKFNALRKAVYGFTYRKVVGQPIISLDENIEGSFRYTVKPHDGIPAIELVELFGEKEVFKSLLEQLLTSDTWYAAAPSHQLNNNPPLHIILLRGFDWESTEEGHTFWSDINSKIKRLEARYGITAGRFN